MPTVSGALAFQAAQREAAQKKAAKKKAAAAKQKATQQKAARQNISKKPAGNVSHVAKSSSRVDVVPKKDMLQVGIMPEVGSYFETGDLRCLYCRGKLDMVKHPYGKELGAHFTFKRPIV